MNTPQDKESFFFIFIASHSLPGGLRRKKCFYFIDLSHIEKIKRSLDCER